MLEAKRVHHMPARRDTITAQHLNFPSNRETELMRNDQLMTNTASLPTHHQTADHLIVAEARRVVQSGDYSLILRCSAQLADQARRSDQGLRPGD